MLWIPECPSIVPHFMPSRVVSLLERLGISHVVLSELKKPSPYLILSILVKLKDSPSTNEVQFPLRSGILDKNDCP
jgi:hypothetical protein